MLVGNDMSWPHTSDLCMAGTVQALPVKYGKYADVSVLGALLTSALMLILQDSLYEKYCKTPCMAPL